MFKITQTNYKMKKILLFTLLILSVSSVIGQEIVRYSSFRHRGNPPLVKRSGNNFCVGIYVDGAEGPFRYDDLEFDLDYAMAVNGIGDTSIVQHGIVLNYELGKGYTGGVGLNYSASVQGVDAEGDLIVFADQAAAIAVNDSLLFGVIDSTNTIDPSSVPQNIMIIYDQSSDSIIYSEPLELFHTTNSTGFDYLKLDGDYIYVETSFLDSMTYLGKKFYQQIPFWFGKETVIHKVNWRTNEIIWSNQIGSRYIYDKIDGLEIDEDGNVTVGIFLESQAYLNGEVLLDSNGEPYFGLCFYKFTSTGDVIDVRPITFKVPRIKSFRIAKDGSVYIHGIANPETVVTVGDDTIRSPELAVSSPLFVKLDADLNYDWHTTYYSNELTIMTSANAGFDGSVYLSSTLRDTLVIDDKVLVKGYTGPDATDSDVMFKIGAEGKLLGEPYRFTGDLTVFDIYEIEPEYYVVVIEGIFWGYDFLDATIPDLSGPDYAPSLEIWEVKGNLFSVLTAIQDYKQVSSFAVYPSPALEKVRIRDLPPTFESERTTVSIYEFSGRLELSLIRSSLDLASGIDVSTLAPGPKIITLTNGAHVITSKFVKR